MASPLPRPRQVQLAGWLIIVSAVLTLAGAYDQVRAIGSLELAEEIERQLDRPLFDGLSLSIDEIEQTIKVLSIIGAVCASTMAILAWQMLATRSRAARGWLTALALPAFFTGMVGDGFFTTLTVIAVGLLWTQPAREWFAGTWKPTAPRTPATRADTAGQRVAAPLAPEPVRTPPSVEAPGAPDAPAPGDTPQPPPSAAWPPPVAAPVPAEGAHGVRPGAVMGAAILTWVFSLVSAIAFVAVMAVTALDPDRVMDEMRRINPELMAQEGITEGMVQLMFVFLAGVVVLWTASACTLAFLVVRRVAWARVVLIVCAGAAGLVLILAATASPLMLAPFLAASATVGLLLRRDVAAWLSRP